MDLNTLMIMGSVAGSSFGLGVYITKIGNNLKDALTDHKIEDGEKFHDHALRLGEIDLILKGYTHSGKNPDRMDPKYPG